ncbi:hypothetical protein C0992_009838 [Termitomyces sp. T32_za158]|nr:hypothetical protein C0992_009838 [Termitomyces sp. T32_za158]
MDLSDINAALSDVTHPLPTLARHKVCARARGHGHRRRAQASRSSVYETIEEEKMNSPMSQKTSPHTLKDTPTIRRPLKPDNDRVGLAQISNNESGTLTLRRYYALRDEARTTVVESKRVWRDTPSSIFAIQSFEPPRHPAGMQALLEHSVKNYGPLPSELRPRRVRSRTSSRPSPYPQARVNKAVLSSPAEKVHLSKDTSSPSVLQQVPINTNLASTAPLHAFKSFLPVPVVKDVEPKQVSNLGPLTHARTRAGSAPRRNAPVSTKRNNGSTKTSTDLKENVGQGTLVKYVQLCGYDDLELTNHTAPAILLESTVLVLVGV